MSLPGIFSPVRYQGHTYVDGGLLNNIPLNVAKDMGAEYLLGIHLQTASLNPNEQLSSFAVLGEAISVMIAANEDRSKPLAEIGKTWQLPNGPKPPIFPAKSSGRSS